MGDPLRHHHHHPDSGLNNEARLGRQEAAMTFSASSTLRRNMRESKAKKSQPSGDGAGFWVVVASSGGSLGAAKLGGCAVVTAAHVSAQDYVTRNRTDRRRWWDDPIVPVGDNNASFDELLCSLLLRCVWSLESTSGP